MGAWGAVGVEGLESRRLLAYVPVDTSDASYDLVIDGINTAATPIHATSFAVGLSRKINAPTGSSADREAAPPDGQPVSVLVESGAFTTALMQAALTGKSAAHATLIAHRTGDPSVEYERWTLDDAQVTGYQTSDNAGSGGVTYDSITLGYSAVAVTVTPRDTAGQAMAGVSGGWNFATAKATGAQPSYGGQFFDPPLDQVLEVNGGQIPIASYSWGVTNVPSAGGNTLKVAQFSLTATGGIATPALFWNAAHGPAAEVVLTSRDSSGRIYSRWVLEDAVLAAYSTSDASGDGSARTESFNLDAVKIERAVYTYDAKGGVTTTQTGIDLGSGLTYSTGSLALTTGFASLDPVSPDPRQAPVSALTVRFPEKLIDTSVPHDFALFRDGHPIDVSGLGVSTSDHVSWKITGLSALTAQAGRYTFNVFAPGSELYAVSGADIVQGDSVSWTMNATVPAVTATSAAPEGGAPLVVRVTFSVPVTGLTAGDLTLVPASSPGTSITPGAVAWDAVARTAKFTFTGPLANGNYTAQMAANAVTDSGGNPLAAAASIPTFVLAGDVNRDRAVNFNDLLILARNYNGTGKQWADGDLTGDGVVNFNDLLILARAYNTTLAAPSAPVMASVPADSASVLGTDTAKKPVFSATAVATPAPTPSKPKVVVRPKR